MTYTVRYRRKWLWKKIKNVKGDGIVETGSHRFFILDDETRLEIPLNYSFQFSVERFFSIKQRMEAESGQNIKVR